MTKLMSIKEVSALINLSVPTLYKLVSERGIPFFKINRRVLFDRENIEKWVQQHAQPVLNGNQNEKTTMPGTEFIQRSRL